jgi:hypothetical protein
VNIPMGPSTWTGDGAANQFYMDELDPDLNSERPYPGSAPAFTPLFYYPGSNLVKDGTVAMLRRNQPTLEIPGIDFLGRMVFLGFGLEGVNNGLPGTTSRAQLLATLLDWAMDEPEVTIEDWTSDGSETGQQILLAATLTSNIDGTTAVNYRWDFGDGTPYTTAHSSRYASHQYETCGAYTVRVEAKDSWGNVAIGSTEIEVTQGCQYKIYLPLVAKAELP